MKVLVLGAGGMAGHTISIYFKEQGHEVVGFARERLDYVNTIVGDATNFDFLNKVISEGNFDGIINCIGILNQFAEINKANAVLLNGYLPHYLVEITKNCKTKVIQMSTDCVFSGKTGNYTEKSLRDGETFYDRSKAIGEIEDNKNITLRNSIVGPDINKNGIGLLNWFMKQEGEIEGYSMAMWTGLTTLQLAKIMEQALIKDATGLYNMVPECNISKYDLLKLFNYYLRKDTIRIKSSDKIKIDKTLVRTNYEFDVTVPDYETMVREMAEWIIEHKYLYPHYNI